MTTLFTVLHILVCLVLILVVLLQTGKGSEMGAVFGGASSQTVFGSGGAAPFLSKFTTGAAIVFMLTSLVLATLSGGPGTSIMEGESEPVATVPVVPSAKEGTVPETEVPPVTATDTKAEAPQATATEGEHAPTEAVPPTTTSPEVPKESEKSSSAAH